MKEITFHIKEGAPKQVTELQIKQYLEENDLIVKVSTRMSDGILSAPFYNDAVEKAQEKMANAMANEINSKVKWISFREPILHDNVFYGELITFSEKQLIEMLSHFGVDVHVDPLNKG